RGQPFSWPWRQARPGSSGTACQGGRPGTPKKPDPKQTHAPAWVRTAFGDADDTGHALQLCHTTSGPSSQDRCFVTGLATPRGFMSGCQSLTLTNRTAIGYTIHTPTRGVWIVSNIEMKV